MRSDSRQKKTIIGANRLTDRSMRITNSWLTGEKIVRLSFVCSSFEWVIHIVIDIGLIHDLVPDHDPDLGNDEADVMIG